MLLSLLKIVAITFPLSVPFCIFVEAILFIHANFFQRTHLSFKFILCILLGI